MVSLLAENFRGKKKVIVSIDGIFGLPRKKAAGESVRPPLHGQLFFHDQNMVDEYVGSAAKVNSTCTSNKVTFARRCTLVNSDVWQ